MTETYSSSNSNKGGLPDSIWHEITLICRYVRMYFQRKLHSPLWRFIGGQEPIYDYDPGDMIEAVEPELLEMPEPLPQKAISVSHEPSERDKLLERFGKKFNARENRKKMAMQEDARKHGSLEDNRQMTFDFENTSLSDDIQQIQEDTEEFAYDGEYTLPHISLLVVKDDKVFIDKQEIADNTRKIQDCLDSFSVDAEVDGTVHGPRVTLYKINVGKGVRVQSITTYTSDLKSALMAASLRILAPVPGRQYAGIEVPNKTADQVPFGNIINSRAWRDSKAMLPLVVGRNIEGLDILLDLAKAPHLLVAGATGSGKSVALNTFIMSLICKYSPDDLKLMLVDPKRVEMQAYSKLPHLMVPIINDPEVVTIALRWLVIEMERRYRILGKTGVRDLASFNKRELGDNVIYDDDNNPIPARLPYVVLVIDELADIMLVAKKDVEINLSRLAAKSRAVGIHTIVATQRPSVDVLTGTIKNNFPVRIAFKTASQIDSRTILDYMGAESLLGQGDMLLNTTSFDGFQRIQGAMVTDQEINDVVEFCAMQAPAPRNFDTIQNVVAQQEKETEGNADSDSGDNGDSHDDDLHAAIEIILAEHKATTSSIQRRMKIGYNRAATIIEELERRHIVGPAAPGSNKREIFIESMEDAEQLLNS